MFDSMAMHNHAVERYSFQTVAGQFDEFYKKINFYSPIPERSHLV